MSIVLIGYRGSGKTTIGKRLADRLWQPFIDVDDRIVQKAGKSIKDIFEQDGEPFFRDIESQVVEEVIALPEHVIALGGGTLGREQNRQAVRKSGHQVIYLQCDPVELHKRVAADPQSAQTRPNLTELGGGVDEIRKMVAERQPLYRAAMTAELDVTHLTPEDAVVYIVRLL